MNSEVSRSFDTRPWASRRPENGLPMLLCVLSALIVPMTFSMFRIDGGVVIRLADVFAAVTLLATLLTNPVGLANGLLRSGLWAFLALILYMVCQGAYLGVLPETAKEAVQLIFVFLSLVAACLYAEKYPRLFLAVFVTGMLISAGTTVAYHLSLGQLTRYKHAGDGRYIFGNLSALLLLVASGKRWPLKWVLGFVVSLVPLALSLERRGQVGVAAVAALLALAGVARMLRIRRGVVIGLSAIAVAASATVYFTSYATPFHDVVEKYGALTDEEESLALFTSDIHRRSLLVNGFALFQDHWLAGVGAGEIKNNMRQYYVNQRLVNGTHNFYLDMLLSYGIVWTILLIVFGAGVIRSRIYSLEGGLLIFYSVFTVAFMATGGSTLVMIFSSLLFAGLTRPVERPVEEEARIGAAP